MGQDGRQVILIQNGKGTMTTAHVPVPDYISSSLVDIPLTRRRKPTMNGPTNMTDHLLVDAVDILQVRVWAHWFHVQIGFQIHFLSLAIEILDREAPIYARVQITNEGAFIQ